MKRQKEILLGILISVVGFIIAIIVALIVVGSKVPSNASNDGWLGFLGGLFGSFISGMITFGVLYINRKDMEDGERKRYKISEMDRMEGYLKEAFNLIRIADATNSALTNFLLIRNMIEPQYQDSAYYEEIEKNIMECEGLFAVTILANEEHTYREFIKYRKQYIESR